MIRRLIPLSLLFFALSAQAQEAPAISPIVSFDYGSPLFINRAPAVLNLLPGTISGASSRASYGAGAELFFPMGLPGRLGLVGQIEGVYSTGSFTASSFSITGHDIVLRMEAGARWKLSPFAVTAGPWISQRFAGGSVVETDSTGTNNTPPNAMSRVTHLGLFAGLTWNIPHFPLRPELNAHLDLTELPEAGSNAWSVGLSLAYVFGGEYHTLPLPKMTQAKAWATPPIPPSVHFLVNGSLAAGNPPLERVETRIKDYRMIDSANAAPRVTQWDEESYHLPHLALAYRVPARSGADLMLFKDSVRLLEKIFARTNSTTGIDTVLDLDKDSAWQNMLALMNTGENNRLIAELRVDSETVRDTLVLPPADTSRAAQTIEKQEFRFEFSDNYSHYAGGEQSLDLMFARIKELLDSSKTIRVIEDTVVRTSTAHAALEKKLSEALGNREIERTASADASEGWIVIIAH